jgi:hypothetical protein
MAFPFVLISLLAGMVLGLRFRVLVLVPTTAMVAALAVSIGFMRALTTWVVVLAVAASIAGLQIGYFAGTIVRHWLPSARTNRARPTSLAAHGQ